MRIGVDLGGTKIEAIALAPDGRELARRRVATPQHEGYEAIVAAVAGLARGLEEELGATGTVGVGTPGAVSSATGLLKNSNTVCLNARPIVDDLSRALDREVRVANDADCFALSEAVDGAGAGAPTVFGVIAGTGVGGGLVVEGRLVRGPNAVAGEWGHSPLPWPRDDERPGPPCYCGRHGCVETWLAGPSLEADHARVTGEPVPPPELAARAAAGDAAAAATLDRHADRFARGLATVIHVVDPYVVALGGGVSNLPGLPERVAARLPRYVFGSRLFEGGASGGEVRTRVVRAVHGDSGGVRGAAWLWPADPAR